MIDPRLNLFWSYDVPDSGAVDAGLGTHEDNLTRGLLVTLRLLGPEATTAFLQQVGVPCDGAAQWRYYLHRSVSKRPTETPFLLGIHAGGDRVDPRSAD